MRLWTKKRRWLAAIAAVLLTVIAVVARPTLHLVHEAIIDRNEIRPLPAGMVDDASRLNETRVAEICDVPADDQEAESQLRELLARARKDGLHVSVVGAHHSMGGQTIYPGGIQINMAPHHQMKLDERNRLLHVQAGALWSEIVP